MARAWRSVPPPRPTLKIEPWCLLEVQRITGLDDAASIAGVQVFHAGTSLLDGNYLTNGGRVLAVTAAADSLEKALGLAYEGIGKIHFDGMYYRRDIGHRALKAKV